MKTPEDRELVDPKRELWLEFNLPIYLIRFYEPVAILNGSALTLSQAPVIEHVYKPTGMYHYKKALGKEFHYEYTETRRI